MSATARKRSTSANDASDVNTAMVANILARIHIPSEWLLVPLGDLCSFSNGFNADKSAYGRGIPFINVLDVITHTHIREQDIPGLVQVATPVLDAFTVIRGDILFNRTSETQKEVGLSAVYSDDATVVFGGFVIRGRFVDDSMDSTYVGYGFRSTAVRIQIIAQGQGAIRANIGQANLKRVLIPVPPKPEQRAITDALSDADRLLGVLEALIAKKRTIKRATMQQLITGKTRLPGFQCKAGHKRTEVGVIPQDWEVRSLRSCLRYAPGYGINAPAVPFDDNLPTYLRITDISEDGRFKPSPRVSVDHQDSEAFFLNEGDLVFTRTGASVGKSYLYNPNDGPLVFAGFLIRVCPDSSKIHPTYLAYYAQSQSYWNWVSIMSMRSGQPGINGQEYGTLQVPLPNPIEQAAIATVLSNMDAEITALQKRRDKTRAIKQGMMQQLLTGRVRLVKPEAPAGQAEVEPKTSRTHNWAFNEAVVISVLAKQFGSGQYPLGRMRRTKLAYLLNRHAEKRAEGYLKKAAGPYNPRTRYGGPEKIAVENGYVRQHKSGRLNGFIAADNIAQAEGYFEKWYGPGCIQWLEQFRRKKNDDLEVLTTVDMAAEELCAEGKKVDVDTVKNVIRSHPEWKAKLNRPVFSDDNIARAIKACRTLFD